MFVWTSKKIQFLVLSLTFSSVGYCQEPSEIPNPSINAIKDKTQNPEILKKLENVDKILIASKSEIQASTLKKINDALAKLAGEEGIADGVPADINATIHGRLNQVLGFILNATIQNAFGAVTDTSLANGRSIFSRLKCFLPSEIISDIEAEKENIKTEYIKFIPNLNVIDELNSEGEIAKAISATNADKELEIGKAGTLLTNLEELGRNLDGIIVKLTAVQTLKMEEYKFTENGIDATTLFSAIAEDDTFEEELKDNIQKIKDVQNDFTEEFKALFKTDGAVIKIGTKITGLTIETFENAEFSLEEDIATVKTLKTAVESNIITSQSLEKDWGPGLGDLTSKIAGTLPDQTDIKFTKMLDKIADSEQRKDYEAKILKKWDEITNNTLNPIFGRIEDRNISQPYTVFSLLHMLVRDLRGTQSIFDSELFTAVKSGMKLLDDSITALNSQRTGEASELVMENMTGIFDLLAIKTNGIKLVGDQTLTGTITSDIEAVNTLIVGLITDGKVGVPYKNLSDIVFISNYKCSKTIEDMKKTQDENIKKFYVAAFGSHLTDMRRIFSLDEVFRKLGEPAQESSNTIFGLAKKHKIELKKIEYIKEKLDFCPALGEKAKGEKNIAKYIDDQLGEREGTTGLFCELMKETSTENLLETLKTTVATLEAEIYKEFDKAIVPNPITIGEKNIVRYGGENPEVYELRYEKLLDVAAMTFEKVVFELQAYPLVQHILSKNPEKKLGNWQLCDKESVENQLGFVKFSIEKGAKYLGEEVSENLLLMKKIGDSGESLSPTDQLDGFYTLIGKRVNLSNIEGEETLGGTAVELLDLTTDVVPDAPGNGIPGDTPSSTLDKETNALVKEKLKEIVKNIAKIEELRLPINFCAVLDKLDLIKPKLEKIKAIAGVSNSDKLQKSRLTGSPEAHYADSAQLFGILNGITFEAAAQLLINIIGSKTDVSDVKGGTIFSKINYGKSSSTENVKISDIQILLNKIKAEISYYYKNFTFLGEESKSSKIRAKLVELHGEITADTFTTPTKIDALITKLKEIGGMINPPSTV